MWIDGRLRKTDGAAALLLMLLICIGCGKGDSLPRDVEQEKNAVVLRVEGWEFTTGDFADYVKSGVGEEAENLSPEALSRLFDRFFDEKILLAAARLKNVALTDEEKEGVRRLLDFEDGRGEIGLSGRNLGRSRFRKPFRRSGPGGVGNAIRETARRKICPADSAGDRSDAGRDQSVL